MALVRPQTVAVAPLTGVARPACRRPLVEAEAGMRPTPPPVAAPVFEAAGRPTVVVAACVVVVVRRFQGPVDVTPLILAALLDTAIVAASREEGLAVETKFRLSAGTAVAPARRPYTARPSVSPPALAGPPT